MNPFLGIRVIICIQNIFTKLFFNSFIKSILTLSSVRRQEIVIALFRIILLVPLVLMGKSSLTTAFKRTILNTTLFL